jgi:hypothetical protein
VIGPIFRKVHVTLMATEDLLRGLRTSKMCHHLRIAKQLFEQWQILL